ncbi:MAG: leucine-rich repeat protein [Clostridia bacterium]|nr:leucine-rich repeat protein [Clostridia bacterium]
MAVLKCKMCGGELSIEEGSTICICDYCGTKQTVPNLNNEKKRKQFDRANRLRMLCEFDKAYSVYETIADEFPEEAEAYWGLVLCKYGIEYVDDPKTESKIPTCHRSSFDSVFADENYELTIENADIEAKTVYREEAKTIEELRKSIIEISSKEEPYDIFICYKETDEKGERTIDSVIAQDVYDALTNRGYKVFFSRITLEEKLGRAYEPYIFSALHSAKVMLVFGTSYDYFNAVWVKNEWSRFLKLMEQDSTRALIPCFKGIDAYDMPREFAKLQAQDMGKVGAKQDLVRGIGKIIVKKEEGFTNQPSTAMHNTYVDPLIDRANGFLKVGEFAKAKEFFEKALGFEPNNESAHLGLLLVEGRASTLEELENNDELLDNLASYFVLISTCSDEIKEELQRITKKIESNIIEKASDSLKAKKWSVAQDYYRKLSGHDEQKYLLGMLLCEFKVTSKEALTKLTTEIAGSTYYQQLYACGDNQTKLFLNSCKKSIRENILNSADEYLKKRAFPTAKTKYKSILQNEPDNQRALLGMLFAERQAVNFDELGLGRNPLDKEEAYKSLINICDESTKKKLLNCKSRIEDSIKKEIRKSKNLVLRKYLILFGVFAVICAIIGVLIYFHTDKYVYGLKQVEGGYEITNVKADKIVNETGHLEIPSEIKGVPVVRIGDSAFMNCDSIKSISIPDSVISIGNSAFYGCQSLTSIVIPNGVTVISDSMLMNCYSLTSAVIPGGITDIGSKAFSNCKALTSIVIPQGVNSIGDSAFSNCRSLTSIAIPKDVKSIGTHAFLECKALVSIDVNENNTSYESIDGNLYTEDTKTLIQYAVGKKDSTFLVPSHVTVIGDSAFSYCEALTYMEIPKNVTTVSDSAFMHCGALTTVIIPDSVTQINDSVFMWCYGLKNVEIPSSVISIGDFAFSDCDALITVEIPDSVTDIGNSAFSYCSALTSVVLPDSVTSIGEHAFSYCEALTRVVIPKSVAYIGEYAFSCCRSLTIYAEAQSEPKDWNTWWNDSKAPVVWKYTE